MTKKNKVSILLTTVFLFTFVTLGLIFPQTAKAYSLQQIYSPITSFLTAVGERIQYTLAFTPEKKVEVLENHAQKRLIDATETSIKEYLDIKNKQNTLLDKVDSDTFKQIQEQTIEEQKTLAKIGNDKPNVAENVKTINKTVVEGIKGTVTLKEGTTAGEAFDQKALIIYAPGTGPGGNATLVIEGQKYAPGTSGGGSATNDIKNVVIEGGGGTSGGTGGTTTVVGQ